MRDILTDKRKKLELEEYILNHLFDYRSPNLGSSIVMIDINTLIDKNDNSSRIHITYRQDLIDDRVNYYKQTKILSMLGDDLICDSTSGDIDLPGLITIIILNYKIEYGN